MIYKSTLTIIFDVILSCYILGVEGVHYGNVPVENNANRFLFCNTNWPIFIHDGGSRHTAPA